MPERISGGAVHLHRMSLVCRRNRVMTRVPRFPARFELRAGVLLHSTQTPTVRQVIPMICDVSWPYGSPSYHVVHSDRISAVLLQRRPGGRQMNRQV